KFLDKACWYSGLSGCPGKILLGGFADAVLSEEPVDVLRTDVRQRPDDMQLGCSAAQLIDEPAGNSAFAVLHARRDFGQQDVAFGEMREALSHVTQGTLFGKDEVGLCLAYARYWDKGHGH